MGVIENIKNKLEEVVNSGRKVEDLTASDSVYKYVKDAKVVVNGVKLTTEEKFALAGYPRPAKNRDLAEYIKKAIIEYRNNGGDFNVDYKDLPFIAEVRSYVNHYNTRHGSDISIEDCLHNFGAYEVSKTYKRYADIMQVRHFVDKQGFADSYRKHSQFCGYISKVSASLDMIDGYVVSLIGNQDLKHCYLDADYIKLVAKRIEKFAYSNQITDGKLSLSLLSVKDPTLYQQVTWIVNNFCSFTGEDLSRNEVLYLLGIKEDIPEIYAKTDKQKEQYFLDSMEILKATAVKNGGTISRKDVSDKQYKLIKQKAQRLAIPVTELFRAYDIEYIGGLSRQRFSKVMVEKLPYIKEMRAERDQIYGKYLQENADAPKQIKFENYFNTCVSVYQKYKAKILEQGLIFANENE